MVVAINDWDCGSSFIIITRKCNRTHLQRKIKCLFKIQKIAEREVNPQNVRFMCRKVEAETEIFMGSKKIVKIITMTKW